MPFDAATAKFMEMVNQVRTRPLTEMSPREAREGLVRMRPLFGQGPAMLKVDELTLGQGDAAFSVRLLEPVANPRALIVYLHGGGWVTGDLDDFDALARKLAASSRCAVLMVNYRLAPEHPFPASINDALVALQWAFHNAEGRSGNRPLPVMVMGDSAGANLATVAARRLVMNSGPALAAQILIYPVTDADFERPSYGAPETQGLLTGEAMRWYWNHYLPDVAGRQHPDASPLRADDLTGLPPTLLLTAECDPLRDEGEAYAARLVEAGVPTHFERYAGQIHGFFSMTNVLPASDVALDQITRFIDSTLAR